MSEKQNYDDSSIQILEGLEAVRKRPGMYISSTDSRGLHHLVWEIVDNAIDEALAGYGKEINVTINSDNSIEVNDFGRGVPCGMHPSGKNTLEVIFTILHAGGKFSSSGGYKVSGGLHGVGSSVVNALSSFLEVKSYKDGKIHFMRFENGGKKACEMQILGDTKRTGTTVTFKPDPTIFSTTLYNYDTIKERLRESAFLIKGITITLEDKRSKKKEVFLYNEGIKEYVAFLNKGKETNGEIAYFTGRNSDIEIEFAMQYTSLYGETLISFVNNIRTKDGGTHETGLKSAITKVVNDYARRHNLLKEKDNNLDGIDIREGLTSIISVRIPENILEFESQTKDKLGTPVCKVAVDTVIFEKLNFYLEEHPDLAQTIVRKAIKAYLAREAARKARDEMRLDKKRLKKEVNLSGKLSPCQGKDRSINELYIVEGDSAGGSAKQGRDRRFQAILPLRGKVLNTEKAKMEDVLKNEEIFTIIHTIGADFGADFDIKKANYNKIIIMTDADTDGAHIQVLLLTFLFRYMRPLIEAGMVYIALPPLYKVTKKLKGKDQIEYAWNDEQLKDLTKNQKNYNIQRYKGLGEMNADQLWDTTMNPQTRTLIKVSIDDISDAEKRIEVLMGDQVEPRRDWIENHVSFTMEDDYVLEMERE